MSSDIVILEQEEDIAELLQYNFAQGGFVAHLAEDIRQVKELVYAKFPRVVLLGTCESPQKRAELSKWIRATKHMEKVIIIFLTTDRDCHQHAYNQEAGVDLCVFSPIKPQELLRVVRKLLQESSIKE